MVFLPCLIQYCRCVILTTPRLLYLSSDRVKSENRSIRLTQIAGISTHGKSLSTCWPSPSHWRVSPSCSLPDVYSDGFKSQTISRLIHYPKATETRSYVLVTDLQVAPLRNMALVFILALREPNHRCPFHDSVCPANHRIEFFRKCS